MIVLDGIEFDCDISLSRTIKIENKYKVVTKDNLTHREVLGKKHSVKISFSNKNKESYDLLFETLSQEIPYHTLTCMWGQETKTMQVMINSISDEFLYKDNEGNVFDELSIVFEER